MSLLKTKKEGKSSKEQLHKNVHVLLTQMNCTQKASLDGLGFSSLVQCLPSMSKAMGSTLH